MIERLKPVLSSLLAFLVFFSPLQKLLAETSYPAIDGDAAEHLASIFKNYNTLGACVATFSNGSITGVYCYGQRWIGGPEITQDTAFQVGSISKLVSVIGLLNLLENSDFTLDSELGELLGMTVRHPHYPDVPVTLRQLLTHTASLKDNGDYQASLQGKSRSLATVFGKHATYAFISDTKPGTEYSYCNFGGGLIGSLIEKLSGEDTDSYMNRSVFEPLNIKAAYHAGLLQGQTPMADIYNMEKHFLTHSLREDQSLPENADAMLNYDLTAGRLIISAPDLCKILIALCDGGVCDNTRILSEAMTEEMLTCQDWRGSVDCECGSGLIIRIIENDEVEGRTMYGHGGKAYGMLCAAFFDPADRTGVVMLTNGCNANAFYNGVGLLGRTVLTACYDDWINPSHQTEDAYAVE